MSDIEELHKLLEEEEANLDPTPVPAKKRENKDVLRFIRKVGLAPGDNKVPTYVIYYHFIKWCKPVWGDYGVKRSSLELLRNTSN